MASHYVFDPKFCLCRKANEKPRAEGLVKYFRKRYLVPVPSFNSWDELNEYLRDCCLADRNRKVGKRTVTIAERWEEDRAASFPLPPHPYDACVTEETSSDHQQLVIYDYVSYSVPAEYAFLPITIKARVHRIEIVRRERVIAGHARSYERGEKVLDPIHYLPTLERKPGAFDHMDCIRKWKLSPVFERLRAELEHRWEGSRGTKEYIQVLRLHERFGTSSIAAAAEFCLERGCAGEDAIRMRLEQQQLLPSEEIPSLDLSRHPRLARVEVEPLELWHFNQLMGNPVVAVGQEQPVVRHGENGSVAPNNNDRRHNSVDGGHNKNIPDDGGSTYDRDSKSSFAELSEAVATARDGP